MIIGYKVFRRDRNRGLVSVFPSAAEIEYRERGETVGKNMFFFTSSHEANSFADSLNRQKTTAIWKIQAYRPRPAPHRLILADEIVRLSKEEIAWAWKKLSNGEDTPLLLTGFHTFYSVLVTDRLKMIERVQ